MFQFYFKEKFDVLSSRYRNVRKMQLSLVLLALFIYTIFKESIYTSHLYPRPPPTGDSLGIAGVRCWTITF